VEDQKAPKSDSLSSAKSRSALLLQDLLELIKNEAVKHPIAFSEAKTHTPPSKHLAKNRWLLKSLVIFPWIMITVFGISFFWDFLGVSSVLFGHTFEYNGLLRIISVSSIIGYVTNWVAIKMLFRPRKPRPILGHGLIPAQKERIAFRLAQAVSKDLINPELIQQKIHESGLVSQYRERITLYLKDFMESADFRQSLKLLLKSYLDDLLSDAEFRAELAKQIVEKLDSLLEKKFMEKVALKVYTTVKGRDTHQVIQEALANLPSMLDSGFDRIDEILDDLPIKMDEYGPKIEDLFTALLYRLINQLDVHELVETNLRRFDESKLEGLILGATNEQLHYIQYLGALFGAIGGFVIWEPIIATVVLAVIIGGILGLDRLLGGVYDEVENKKA
jgi:uncharacterized membrane-anchored protein YjiN (DUF445 family)